MKRETTLHTVARNIALLLSITGWSNKELSRRTKGDVSDRTIGLVLSETQNPGVDTLAAIAEAFGYEPHHLLMPDFDPEILKSGNFDRLIHAYASADDEGRRVMENTADYIARRQEVPANDPKHPGKRRGNGSES